MMFWKKDDKAKDIEELKRKMGDLENTARHVETLNNLLQERVDQLARDIEYIRAATIKTNQAFVELVRSLQEQERVPTPEVNKQRQRMPRTPKIAMQQGQVEQGGAPTTAEPDQLETTIMNLLKDGTSMTAIEITSKVNRTREHVSRVLKDMSVGGKLNRTKRGKVFVYSIGPAS